MNVLYTFLLPIAVCNSFVSLTEKGHLISSTAVSPIKPSEYIKQIYKY